MNEHSGVVGGIDLGGTKCLGVIANLAGQVIHEDLIYVADVGDAATATELMCRRLADAADAAGTPIRALAAGVPAVIDPATGLAVRGPNTGWEGFDVDAILGVLGVPHAVGNDVNLAALAEWRAGRARGVQDFAMVSIGTGLGGGLVSGGRFLNGANQAAGEFGGLLGSPLNAADPVDLEHTLSGAGIRAAALAYLAANPDAERELGLARDARAVIEAAAAGGIHGLRLLEPVLDALTYCIVTLSAVVDPALVVLDGSVGRGLAPFGDRIRERVARLLPAPPIIEFSNLRPTGTALGAVHRALQLIESAQTDKEVSHVE